MRAFLILYMTAPAAGVGDELTQRRHAVLQRHAASVANDGAHHDAVRVPLDRRRSRGRHRPLREARDRHRRLVRHRRRDRAGARRHGRGRDARRAGHRGRRPRRARDLRVDRERRGSGAARADRRQVDRRVRRRLGRAASRSRRECRRHGAAGARALARGLRAAVRHEPPRALRAHGRAPRRARRGRCRAHRLGELERAPTVARGLRRPQLPLSAVRPVGGVRPVEDGQRALRRRRDGGGRATASPPTRSCPGRS